MLVTEIPEKLILSLSEPH